MISGGGAVNRNGGGLLNWSMSTGETALEVGGGHGGGAGVATSVLKKVLLVEGNSGGGGGGRFNADSSLKVSILLKSIW